MSPLDPGIAGTSWGGLEKVLGRTCSEVAWSEQALGPFSSSLEQGHLYVSCLKSLAEGKGFVPSLEKKRLENPERSTSLGHSSLAIHAVPL